MAEIEDYDTELLPITVPHMYVSTSCTHGLHTRCRLTCKFCTALCLCDCHG